MTVLKNWFTAFGFLLLTICILAVFLVIKYYYSKRRLFRLGAKLPGPKPWPIIGNAWDFLDKDLDILAKLRNYKENHQSGLYALWFGHGLHVFINSPELAEAHCQSTKILDRGEKVKWIREELNVNGIVLANGDKWRKAKKLTESALPYSNLKYYIPIFQKEGNILIELLQCEVGKPSFSLVAYVKKCIFDIISEITVEWDEKAQSSGDTNIEELDLVLQLCTKRVYNIWQQWGFLYQFSSDGKKFYRLRESSHNLANREIIKRKKEYEEEKRKLKYEGNESNSRRKIFWKVLFDYEDLTLDELRDHIFSFVPAAYETSSHAICFVLVMLALHPDVQEKVYQEIKFAIDGDFDEEKIRKLEYLEMVIKETLRLFPTVPINIRYATEDAQIGEYLIPEGADVTLNFYELHRDPNQYDDPHKFNPDNFLPENVAKRHPYSFIPFSGGLRKCIGGKFAMYVMKVLISMLLLNYKFECDYKTMDDIKVRGDVSLYMPDGFQVRILKR